MADETSQQRILSCRAVDDLLDLGGVAASIQADEHAVRRLQNVAEALKEGGGIVPLKVS